MVMDEYPPYTPMPSLGHELGLMFGFLSLCIVDMVAYIALWRISQTRIHAQNLARRKAHRDKNPTQTPLGTTTSVTAGSPPGPGKDTKPNAAVQEKTLDRIGMPVNRAELPVHGMEIRATPLSPVSPASPVGEITLESIFGVVLEERKSSSQGPFRADEFRSASPARRFGSGIGPAVEIGPAPSRE
ncbi:hypothetical protein N7491_008685 [Penicillium cf. griseofulvum]|uniref:Uncharacterized protein n=1 Tax=Penicillium cf. griseofulvum TaxID=2972120 RepID=A0A9W9JQS7_9EURO|nr:hypothetical protein N7472_005713 [Penicillium cf. griseofulvum]KAJ5423469.1 hypothetical protein N7491_008685 [Penicillium cf. griseofulvum]KAJ5431263.1 hypothetical protein N7445_008995 [Penicillium cf. griseofulvum]